MNNEYNLLSKIYVDMINHVPRIVESEQYPHYRVMEIKPEKYDEWTGQMKVILNKMWTALLDKEAIDEHNQGDLNANDSNKPNLERSLHVFSNKHSSISKAETSRHSN